MLRNDAGYPEVNPAYADSEPTEVLTDAEFAVLRKVEAEIPAGAEISVVLCWDESTEEDEDGDEESVRTNEFKAAKIEWSFGGVDVVVIVPLA
jgi:triosephosphate isomerase